MRRFACAALILLVAAGCGDGSDRPAADDVATAPLDTGPETPAPDRSVLLVTIDTLRWDALGSYGADTPTPALDALAAEGVRFDYAVAHAVVTLPSHAAILTGEDPSRHGIHDNDGYRLDDEASTWAERARAAGYATGAFVGAFPVDSMFGLAQGFDVYDDSYAGEQGQFSLRMVERRAEEVVAPALDWVEGRDGPWFAWVHVYDPHAPYEAPAGWAGRQADPYADEVAYVDATLAPLIDLARSRDAIVIVTSDHGEAFGAHGEDTHGVFAYSATLRVPLIVAGLPDAPAGTVVQAPAAHIDLLPTVLEALGDPDPSLPGRSLYPEIRGQERPEPFGAYFEALTPYLDWGWAPLRGIHEGRLKYIDLPIPELYDLAADADESDNLADRRASDLRRLALRLEDHLAGATGDARTVTEDAETLERLRALGYVSSGGGRPDEDEEFGPEDDPKRLIEEGSLMQAAVIATEEGRLGEAETLLEEVLQSRPDLARAHRQLAAVHKLRDGPAAAADVLERAVADGAASPALLARLGQYQMEAGRLPDAVDSLRAGLEASPDDVEMISLLGGVYGELGRVREAEAMFERGLGLDPTYARLHANRGTLLLATERPAEAEAAFREALRFDDSLADAHNGLGVIAANLRGDYAAAVGHWRRALEYAPDQPLVLFNLGVSLVRLERLEEAERVLERYLELVPDDPDALQILRNLRAR